MNRKRFAFIIALLMLIPLFCRCQLAIENANAAVEPDRMIGVYITREYLDLFNFEAYFNDNTSKLVNGGDIFIEKEKSYEGKIYATEITEEHETSQGEIFTEVKYEFEGLDGIPLFVPTRTDERGNVTSYTISGEAICDGHYSLGNHTYLEATIYARPSNEMISFFTNPVYQSADGSVYLMSGTGLSTNGGFVGGSMAQELTETQDETVNGETASKSFAVKVTFEIRALAEQTVVLQMGKDGAIIRRDVFSDPIPDRFEPAAGTEYLIVESHAYGADESISRTLVEHDEIIVIYTEGDKGLLIPRYIEVDWQAGT